MPSEVSANIIKEVFIMNLNEYAQHLEMLKELASNVKKESEELNQKAKLLEAVASAVTDEIADLFTRTWKIIY